MPGRHGYLMLPGNPHWLVSGTQIKMARLLHQIGKPVKTFGFARRGFQLGASSLFKSRRGDHVNNLELLANIVNGLEAMRRGNVGHQAAMFGSVGVHSEGFSFTDYALSPSNWVIRCPVWGGRNDDGWMGDRGALSHLFHLTSHPVTC